MENEREMAAGGVREWRSCGLDAAYRTRNDHLVGTHLAALDAFGLLLESHHLGKLRGLVGLIIIVIVLGIAACAAALRLFRF